MKSPVSILCLFIIFHVGLLKGESIVFPSGDRFTIVNSADVANPDLYSDVKGTGSILVDSQETPSTLEKGLAKNVLVSQFMTPGARYVRAHPTFMSCLQKVILELKHHAIQVSILRGFITSAVSSGSADDQYLQSGCGVELALKTGSSGTLDDIAAQVFQKEQRDVEVIIKDGYVHFHMAGPGSSGHRLTDNRQGPSILDTEAWIKEQINDGLDPKATVDCSYYSELTSGHHYPANLSHDRVLGLIDVKITRDMAEFKRLVQYQGTNIQFENSEGGTAWCGNETNTCPSTCADGLQGNSIENRCADRVMSSRMLALLNKVQKKVRINMADVPMVPTALGVIPGQQ